MKQSLRISFELFPAKTDAGFNALCETIKQLKVLTPDFFSVTYGAGGTTHGGTLALVKKISQQFHYSVAPHLTCIGTSENEILQTLQVYQSLNIKRIVALRGDMPKDQVVTGAIDSAVKLIQFIRKNTADHFHIEAAAYPECHPQSINFRDDFKNFKTKISAGANSAITQYFYNPDAYFYFLDACAKHQVYVPIYPGIMPITDHQKLVRFSNLCGAEIPKWILKRLEAYSGDEASVKAFGLEVTQRLCERLIAGGAPGLHFYTLNASQTTIKLLQALKLHPATEPLIA